LEIHAIGVLPQFECATIVVSLVDLLRRTERKSTLLLGHAVADLAVLNELPHLVVDVGVLGAWVGEIE
jgi:hypothetical protein